MTRRKKPPAEPMATPEAAEIEATADEVESVVEDLGAGLDLDPAVEDENEPAAGAADDPSPAAEGQADEVAAGETSALEPGPVSESSRTVPVADDVETEPAPGADDADERSISDEPEEPPASEDDPSLVDEEPVAEGLGTPPAEPSPPEDARYPYRRGYTWARVVGNVIAPTRTVPHPRPLADGHVDQFLDTDIASLPDNLIPLKT